MIDTFVVGIFWYHLVISTMNQTLSNSDNRYQMPCIIYLSRKHDKRILQNQMYRLNLLNWPPQKLNLVDSL